MYPVKLIILIAMISLSACAPHLLNQEPNFSPETEVIHQPLHMLVAGKGTPTVVLESGLGDAMQPWAKVQPELAKFTRVVAYDRAGLGQSAPSSEPRSARQIATELHAALRSAHIAPPYVLVGHSLGGIYIRVFANMYPGEVAGMVLVDPTPEDFFSRVQAVQSPEEQKKFKEMQRAYESNASEGRRSEWRMLASVLEEARSAQPPPKVPITLLTGLGDEPGKPMAVKRLWLDLHREWLRGIPDARHIVSEKSGHYMQLDEPALVNEAIRRTVAGV